MNIFLLILFLIIILPILLGFLCTLNIFNYKIKYNILSFLLRIPLILFNIKILCTNKPEKIKGRTLIISNHISIFDIIAILLSTNRNISFVVKKELYYYPWISIWLKVLGCVPLDRNNLRKSYIIALKDIVEKLKNNYIIAVFPSGTRNQQKQEFKPGIFKVAFLSKCDIIPISLKYKGNFTIKGLLNIFSAKKIYIDYKNIIKYDNYKDMTTFSLSDKLFNIIYK